MDWEKIRQEYESSNITLKDLALKYKVSAGTMRSRKNREKWQRSNVTQRIKQRETKKENVATQHNKTKQSERANSKELEISPELTEKQKLFCLYYIKTYNATMSAIKAGYSKESAHVQGHDNLRNPKISAEIRRLKGRALQDLYIDALDVLEAYAKIAFADITESVEFGNTEEFVYVEGQRVIGVNGDYLTKQVPYVNIKNHDEVDGSLISEVKQSKEGITIKLHDKMKALEILTKYLDILPDHHKRRIEEENLKLGKRKVKVIEEELKLRKEESERKLF